MTVKTLFLLLVMWMPLAVPCHASWDDYDDDWYDYYEDDEDDDWWADDDGCIFGGVIPDVIVDGTDRSDDDWECDVPSDGSFGIGLPEVIVTGSGSSESYDDDDAEDDDSVVWEENWEDENTESDDTNANNAEVGNPGHNKYGERFTKETLDFLKKAGLVELIENLPKDVPVQLFPNECVVDACALLAYFENGKDFDISRGALLDLCIQMGYDLTGTTALPESCIYTVLSSAVDHITKEPFNTSAIESSIDNGHAVLAMLQTDITYIDPPLEPVYQDIAHMVTIIGYDALYYYSMAGDDGYTAIPKASFNNKYYIYTINPNAQ